MTQTQTPNPPSLGLNDLLRMALDGLLPATPDLAQWLDRLEDRA